MLYMYNNGISEEAPSLKAPSIDTSLFKNRFALNMYRLFQEQKQREQTHRYILLELSNLLL